MTAKHRNHLNGRDDWIWIKQGEPRCKLLRYVALIVVTAFCKDQLSCGFIMCLLPLFKSLWPDPDALCVLFAARIILPVCQSSAKQSRRPGRHRTYK